MSTDTTNKLELPKAPPLQGLASYLRAEAVGVPGIAAATLRQWADEVEAAAVPEAAPAEHGLKGIDAGPVSEWQHLVGHGCTPKDTLLIRAIDAERYVQQKRASAAPAESTRTVNIEALRPLLNLKDAPPNGNRVPWALLPQIKATVEKLLATAPVAPLAGFVNELREIQRRYASTLSPNKLDADFLALIDRVASHAAPAVPTETVDELTEWRKLKDPATLHQSLLRGIPANLTADQLLHILGDRAPAVPPKGETLEKIQWRNIRKVVKEAADACFGSPDDPKYGHCHVAMTTILTAKDGIRPVLEPLKIPASTPPAAPQGAVQEQAKALTPDELADKCEAWLQAGGASNIVDAYEGGYREAESCIAPIAAQGGE